MRSTWTELQIHHHDEDKDAIILGLVRPLIEAIQPHAKQAFFVRHWLRGPHVRLRYQSSLDSECVRPLLEERVKAYLASHPSLTVLNEARLLPRHQRLAQEEMEAGPLTPFFPNNSWHFSIYDRRVHVMSPAIANLIETFYADSNDLVFEMLVHVQTGRPRIDLALDLMIAALQVEPLQITSSFVSYRSHAEIFIVGTEDHDHTRRLFDAQYTRCASVLATRLGDIAKRQPFAQSWSALLENYVRLIRKGVYNGEYNFEPYNASRTWTPTQLQVRDRLRRSPFQAAQLDDPANMEARSQHPEFNTFRLLINLVYLHLNRIGVRPYERSLLAHMIANAVEARFGVSALTLVQTHTYAQRAVSDAP